MSDLGEDVITPPEWPVSREDIDRFTNGDCYDLAVAIHDLTGWQLLAALDAECCGHVFLCLPDGRFVDAEGHPTAQYILHQYTWEPPSRIIELQTRDALAREHRWDAPRIDDVVASVARSIVEAVST